MKEDINYGEFAEGLNNKADIDLQNTILASADYVTEWGGVISNISIKALCPDWSRKQTLALNTDITITETGWIFMRNTVYNSRNSGYINGNEVFRNAGTYGVWEDWNSFAFLVDEGDIIKLTGGELIFLPCKGNI